MVFVAVFVFVFVVAPGDVSALGSGNAAVGVIKPVNEHATCEGCDRYRWHAALSEARRLPACDRVPHRSQPNPRAITQGNADLADQLRRASQSIPQNIAEGCGRTARADKVKHYTIARGSAMECAAHLDVMKLDELLESESYERDLDLLERIVAMLTKLIDP